MSNRDEADKCKRQFASGQSEHLTAVKAYNAVDRMGDARYDFCRENYLSMKSLQNIAQLKRQFLEMLSNAGFVRPGLRSKAVEAIGRRNGRTDGVKLALEHGTGSRYNIGSPRTNDVEVEDNKTAPILKALLVASLFPQVVVADKKGNKAGGGSITLKSKDEDETIMIHPQCLLFGEKTLNSKFVVYHQKVKTTKIYMVSKNLYTPSI